MEALFTQFNHFSNLVNRLSSQEYAQISQGQGKILRILNKHGSLSQKELAECMQIRAASMSELLSKLEAKGYIEKKADSIDKRMFNISLTKPGAKEAGKLRKVNTEMFNRIFSVLTEKEKELLSSFMCRIIASIDDKADDGAGGFCVECGLCTQGYKRKTRKAKED